jgi:hypothetical protein
MVSATVSRMPAQLKTKFIQILSTQAAKRRAQVVANSLSSASTMTRITGSVPEARINTRPRPASSVSTFIFPEPMLNFFASRIRD